MTFNKDFIGLYKVIWKYVLMYVNIFNGIIRKFSASEILVRPLFRSARLNGRLTRFYRGELKFFVEASNSFEIPSILIPRLNSLSLNMQ